ncbi:MAG: hypothetical protein AABX70_03290 [Nanoarchaeota archaeon]
MEKKVIIGGIYNSPSGVRYQVDKMVLNATGYEKNSSLIKTILYTQLDNGKYLKGTQWVRSEEDFLKVFELISKKQDKSE